MTNNENIIINETNDTSASANSTLNYLTFDLNGGTGNFPDITGLEGESIVLNEIPEKHQHEFLYWENSSGEIFYTGDTYTFSSLEDTLTAIWEPIVCVICFDYDGGTEVCNNITLWIDGDFIFDFTPVKEHYTFVKWVSGTGEEFYIGDSYTLIEPIETFTAIWEPILYTLTYDLNGGDSPENYPSVQGYYGESTTIPALTPEKEGYNFLQWDSSDGSSYLPGDTYNFTCNDTLSAGWEEKVFYTISFDLDGGSGNFPDLTCEEGEYYALSDVPVKEGYTFIKWASSTGDEYYVNDRYWFVSVEDTLTAIWGYTVNFDLDGGIGAFEPIAKPVGESLNVCETVPVKEGHIFVNWMNSSGQIFDANTPYTFTYGNDTLTAVWQEAEIYKVSFDLAGGTGEFPVLSAVVGDSITIPYGIPVKEGYTFERWEDPNGTAYSQGGTYNNGASTTLRAIWSGSVQFDYNGGEGEDTLRTGLEGDGFTLVTPTRDGYSFVKWVNSVGAEYGMYHFNYGTDTLKAIWKCTLSFNTDGGEALESITKAEGESVTLVAPHKEGFTFIKWVNSSNAEFFEGDEYFFTNGNDTLTAVWGYTVSYDLAGGTGNVVSQIKAPDSDLLIHAGVPEKEGYTFVNWESSDGNKHYVSGEAYTSDANETLTAVWAINGETVITYDLNGGAGEFPKQTKASDESVALYTETPTKEGVVFYRWIDQNGNVYSAGATYEGAEHLTLTAEFRHVYHITYQDFDGNVHTTQEKTEGETVNLFDYEPQSDEYKFVCWKSNDFEGNIYPEDEFSLDMDVTLIPVGKRIYVLVYWSEGEFFELTEKYEGEDTYIIEDTPIRDGYKFVCWKTLVGDKYYLPGHLYTKDEDIGFEAQWVQEDNISVTYSVGDAEGNFPMQELSRGDSVTIHSTVPTKEGYVFECWVEEDAEEDETEDESQNEPQTYSVQRSVTAQNEYYPGVQYALYSSKRLIPYWKKVGVTITNVPTNNMLALSDVSYQLEWVVFPSSLDVTIECQTSDKYVASVYNTGFINVKTPGETTITVKATENNTGKIYTDSFVLLIPDRELENIFSDPDNVMPEDPIVKYKALNKMELYYKNNPTLRLSINNGETCIFAFEGLGDPSLKEKDGNVRNTSAIHPIWLYNAMMVVTKGKEIVYVTRRASTLPDYETGIYSEDGDEKGPTTLKEGIYEYATGNHNSTYVALRPTDDPRISWYRNDGEFLCGKSTGTNLHAGTDHFSSGYENSSGCQIVHYKDYISFGIAVGFLEGNLSDLTSSSHLGDDLYNVIGKVDDKEKDFSKFTKVKYILNRDFDNQNTYTGNSENTDDTPDYSNGVFYPFEHEHIDGVCVLQ